MNIDTDQIKSRVTAFASRTRDMVRTKPHHALAAGIGVVVAVTVLAGVVHIVAHHAPSTTAATAPASESIPTGAAPARVIPAVPRAPVQESIPTGSTPIAAPIAPAAQAAPLTPPAGIKSGLIEVEAFQQDQFGQWSKVSTSTRSAHALTLTSPAGHEHTRTVFTAWVRLTAPASVAVIREAAGSGTGSAAVDGATIAAPSHYYPFDGPVSRTGAVTLAPGWHEIEVTVDRGWNENSHGLQIEVQLGDGVAAPSNVTPWAVPPGAAAAPASATSADASAAASAPASGPVSAPATSAKAEG